MHWGRKKSNKIVFKKNSKVYHLSEKPHSNIRKGTLYVSTNVSDRNKYRQELGIKYITKNGKAYEHTYKIKKNLISPGEKERVDVFLDMYFKNKDMIKNDISKYMNKPYSDRNIQKEGYKIFSELLAAPYTVNSRDKYYQLLKDKGYNSIIDDNDKLYSGLNVNTPLIVFNAYDSLKNYKIKELKKR